MDIDLSGLTRSAFLDSEGRFAKTDEAISVVRLWFGDDSPPSVTDITVDEFYDLSLTNRTLIRNAGSAAGLVETEGKSNA